MATDEILKITDFGLTRVFADVGGRLAALPGTPAYMSPEQVLGLASLDTRSDIYAVGIILSELVSGQRPFQGDYLQAHLSKPPVDPRQHIPDLPAELVAIVARCLRKRPEDRFPTFGRLGKELDGCYRALTGEAPPLPQPTRTPTDAHARAGVGLAQAISLATLGRHDEALGLLDRAVATDPGYAEAWRWRGVGLSALGKVVEAAACFDRAICLDPMDVESRLERGRLYVRLGQREEALRCFEDALAIDGEHLAARYERGTTLFFLGRYGEASRDLSVAYERQPGPSLQAAIRVCARRPVEPAGAWQAPASVVQGLPPLTSWEPANEPQAGGSA